MKPYIVKTGHRFVVPGEQVVEGGGTVYLDDAEALRFADRVDLKASKSTKAMEEVAPVSPAKAKAKAK